MACSVKAHELLSTLSPGDLTYSPPPASPPSPTFQLVSRWSRTPEAWLTLTWLMSYYKQPFPTISLTPLDPSPWPPPFPVYISLVFITWLGNYFPTSLSTPQVVTWGSTIVTFHVCVPARIRILTELRKNDTSSRGTYAELTCHCTSLTILTQLKPSDNRAHLPKLVCQGYRFKFRSDFSKNKNKKN